MGLSYFMNWEKNKIYFIQVIISLSVLSYGLWLINISPAEDPKVKWLMGLIGVIIGYWLK